MSVKKGREERSSEHLAAAISGGVVTAAALAKAGARRAEMQIRLLLLVRASSHISMDMTYSVCPFWSQKRFIRLCKMFSILQLMTTV